ncbi:hypothetical protein BHT94_20865 [Bacillus licheniformis]|nr:hypothetical protein BHT94_20865 [Bacillus licheniformis]
MLKHNQSRTLIQQTLGQIIADELRKRIWKKELEIGQKINEKEISAELEISRSSLREALQILEHEGLVVNKARKGTFIVEFTERDVQEINELRQHIEVPAIMKTALLIEDKQISVLEEMIKEMKRCIVANDWFELFEVDIAFHVYLVQLCGNSRLIHIYNIIKNQIRTILSQLVSYYKERSNEFSEEHESLLRAIKTKDPMEVQKVAISHINHLN